MPVVFRTGFLIQDSGKMQYSDKIRVYVIGLGIIDTLDISKIK